jgi:hypothetical protein
MRKLKAESVDMKKFPNDFPGINKISDLPSGTMQVAQMKRPVHFTFMEEGLFGEMF